MNENNVFMQSERNVPDPRDNESNGNNCVGHYASIDAGGSGHSDNDGCDCLPKLSIDQGGWIMVFVGAIIILKFTKIIANKFGYKQNSL